MSNSYVDEIKVKISEKYKPPCKISMPMSYSQRLTLNKQLQDNRPAYDFSLEKNVLERTQELKDFRKKIVEERQERLDLARKQFDERIQQEKIEMLEKEQAQAQLLEETRKIEANAEQQTQNTYLNTANVDQNQQNYVENQQTYLDHRASQNQQNYFTKNGILMPIPVSSYSANSSNILNPIQISNVNFEPQKPNIKPFNLSDFESDTSSPFDNMELKSINDLEELAQVLKSDRTSYQPNMYQNTSIYQDPMSYNNTGNSYSQLASNTKSYSNFSQNMTQPSRGYEQNVNVSHDSRIYHPNATASQSAINYNQIPSSYSQVTTNFNPNPTFSQYNSQYHPHSSVSYVSSAVSNYSNLNGYYYNTSQMPSNVQLGPTHSTYTPYVSSVTQPSMQKSSCKSVPDLVKSVEKELDTTHLNDKSNISGTAQDRSKNPFYTTTNVPIPTRPKSTDAVYIKSKIKDDIFNPFDRLSKEQKEICRNVSVMGFPLDRVARVCLVFGSDQKKIVDHLLALSDLLDLGFSEKAASDALAKNDNDRDKALDILIS